MSDDGGKNGDKPESTPSNSFPEKITVVYDRQPFDKIADAINKKNGEQNEAATNDNTAGNRQATAQEVGNEIYRRSNRISRIANIISVGLFAATIAVFCLNMCATQAAVQAAKAADTTAKITHYYDSVSLLKQQQSFESNQSEVRKRDSADSLASIAQTKQFKQNYRLAERAFDSSVNANKKTLDAQIDELNEAQSEFNITNEPYLQIDSPYISDFTIGHFLAINFSVENLGKYPVKVDSFKIYFHIAPNPIPFSMLQSKAGYNFDNAVNTYITSGRNFPFAINSNDTNQVADTILIKYPNNWLVYFLGFIKYENLITGTRKTYVFEVALLPKTREWKFIFNDNFRMK